VNVVLRRLIGAFTSPLSVTPSQRCWQAWPPEICACLVYAVFLGASFRRLIHEKDHPFVKPAMLGPVGVLIVGWLLYRTCAHFDHYAPGERPGR
jgi:hypothetical protein